MLNFQLFTFNLTFSEYSTQKGSTVKDIPCHLPTFLLYATTPFCYYAPKGQEKKSKKRFRRKFAKIVSISALRNDQVQMSAREKHLANCMGVVSGDHTREGVGQRLKSIQEEKWCVFEVKQRIFGSYGTWHNMTTTNNLNKPCSVALLNKYGDN